MGKLEKVAEEKVAGLGWASGLGQKLDGGGGPHPRGWCS